MYLGWIFSFIALVLWLARDDVHAAAVVPRRSELDRSSGKREERVVLADTDVVPGKHLRPALADDDRPRVDACARVFLDAEPLSGAVPTVAGGTRALLVCHFLCLDLRDLECRFALTVPTRLPRTRLVLVLEHSDLRPSSMGNDLRRDLRVADERRARPDPHPVGHEEDLVECDRLPGVALAAIDGDLVALFDPVALGPTTDDRVHESGAPPNRKSRRASSATYSKV